MKNLIFECDLSESDVVVLTSAIRDLHKCYPGEFATDVRTAFPALWEHNPYVTELNGSSEVIKCELPPLRDRNHLAQHAIYGFINFFNQKLALQMRPTVFKGDIHLSAEEKCWASQVAEIAREELPFWILVAGDNRDFTVRTWDPGKFQRVIDHFKGRIQFVQIGETTHPSLKGVIDLRGQVGSRQLIRLVYHSQGVLCPPTVHMHLAAAIEPSSDRLKNRPCVVVAGGLEAAHWGAYAHHQHIHTIGALACCSQGGCWKSRVKSLRDGSEHDRRENLCVDVVRKLPRCLDMISDEEVIRRIEMYFQTNVLLPLTRRQDKIASAVVSVGRQMKWKAYELEAVAFRQASEAYIRKIPACPENLRGRGIVICAGAKYSPCAWVTVRMLRKLGCRLPIELWYLGKEEMDDQLKVLLKPFGVRCVDALKVRKKHPARELTGWPLKAYAIKHSRFEQVFLIDADNVPVVNPEFLFDAPEFKQTGAVFWPDIRSGIPRSVWKIFGTPYVKEPEFESGQIIVDKRKCWRALCLALWYNEHSDFCYRYILGDKDTFHLAFRKLGKAFAFIPTPVKMLPGTMCQHDFTGRRIFQHRNQHKWRLTQDNPRVPGFLFEDECRRILEELRLKWLRPPPQSIAPDKSPRTAETQRLFQELTENTYEYLRVGYDVRRMSFQTDGTIGFGGGQLEKFWQVTTLRGRTWLEIFSDDKVICRLKPDGNGNWKGRWNYFEKMPVKLTLEKYPESSVIVNVPFVPARRRILFRAPLNGYTGYGLHANQIVTDLQTMGYEFFIRAIDINETFAPIPENVRKEIVCQEHPSNWELVLSPPGWGPASGKKTVHFTMWESTKLHRRTIPNFNRCECVIVPTHWNAACFHSSGVQRPIHIVPLGIKTDIFRYAPMDMEGPCVFGTAGRLESGGTRKGINLVIEMFKKAFPSQTDVRLHVKIFPDCDVPAETDSRIKFNREYFSEAQMAAWFQGLTCFVSAARGEGWGLMQHQALATGRPIISVRFGGVTEFFTEQMGYPLDFQPVQAEGLYAGCGHWAEPDEKHLMQLMRQVYRDRDQARKLGLTATESASKYSWRESSEKLRHVLQKVGMIE